MSCRLRLARTLRSHTLATRRRVHDAECMTQLTHTQYDSRVTTVTAGTVTAGKWQAHTNSRLSSTHLPLFVQPLAVPRASGLPAAAP